MVIPTVRAHSVPSMVDTKTGPSDKAGWTEQGKDGPDGCSYWEAGKVYMGRSTFHGLSWVTEELPKTFKVATTDNFSFMNIMNKIIQCLSFREGVEKINAIVLSP